VIDLHCHSTCSDGTDTPERLAVLASAAGLRAVALTDHDTVDGFDVFDEACRARGIRAVRATEISCLEDDRSLHVLCYFVSEDRDSGLRGLLGSLSSDRATRNDELLARLAELGYDRVTMDEVRASAGVETTSIGRPHVAEALLRLYPREFTSRQAVFDELLGRTGRAYVRKAHVSVHDASEAARRDGAVTVLAHPLISLMPDVWAEDRTLDEITRRVDPVLGRLRSAGLTGVECLYSRHDALEAERLIELARAHGLIPTGGSDYHGANKPDIALGTGTGRLSVPDGLLDELEAARP
jgi:predicted metal-dependent phosphoesterase TrpH